MLNTLLGTKKTMSQTFIKGRRVPVTKIVVGPCIVTQIKTPQDDGYWSVQLGFGEKRIDRLTKPLRGHLKGALKDSKKAPCFLREVRIAQEPKFKVGDRVNLGDIFSLGDIVAITGVSKGKGFAGVVKRWGFAGGPKTHGQSDRHRAPGSIGQGTNPGRVWKGKKMAGRMGGERKTVKNLKIVFLDEQKNELGVSGPVPGNSGSLVAITRIEKGKDE